MATKCVISLFALLVISAQITHGESERQFRRVRSPSPFGGLLPVPDAGFVNYENLPAGRAGGLGSNLPGLDNAKIPDVAKVPGDAGGLGSKLPGLDNAKIPDVAKVPGDAGGLGSKLPGLDNAKIPDVAKVPGDAGGLGSKLPGLDNAKIPDVAKVPVPGDAGDIPDVTKLAGRASADSVYSQYSDIPDVTKFQYPSADSLYSQFPDYSTYSDMAYTGGIGKNRYGYGSGYADNVKSTVYKTAQVQQSGYAGKEIPRADSLEDSVEGIEISRAEESLEDFVEANILGKGVLNGTNALKPSDKFPRYCATSEEKPSLTLPFDFTQGSRHYFALVCDKTDLGFLKKAFTEDGDVCFKIDDKPRIELSVSRNGAIHTLRGFGDKEIKITCSEENLKKSRFLCLGKEGSGVAFTPHPVHTDNKNYVFIIRCYSDGRQGYTLFSTTSNRLTRSERKAVSEFIDSAGLNSEQTYFEDF